MARGGSRVTLNRQALSALELGIADGLGELGRTIVETAEPPDAEPYGVGLVTSGGYLVFAGSKKVDGWHQEGRQPKKPRAARGSLRERIITLFVGWGFPGRFQEHGTIHHDPQPFARPAVRQVLPQAQEIVREGVAGRLG